MSEFIRIMFMTVFNKSLDEVVGIISTLETERWAAGQEICPKTGKLHIHVYLELSKKRRFSAMGKLFGCHVEDIKKHPVSKRPMYREAWDYTIKDGVYKTKGEGPQPTDNEEVENKFVTCIELAREGKFSEIRDRYPGMYVCHLAKWKQIFAEEQNKEEVPDRRCIWLWGKAGIGKSRWVFQHYPNAYRKNAEETHFERYNREEVICIEDFLPEHRSCWKHPLLLISDRYPCMLRVRYGSACLQHKVLICTSNYRINEIFPHDPARGGESPWQRRFIEIEVTKWNDSKNDLEIRSPDIFTNYLRNMLFKYYIIF